MGGVQEHDLRELDRLIQEHVLGGCAHRHTEWRMCDNGYCEICTDCGDRYPHVPYYSTVYASMGDMLNGMRSKEFECLLEMPAYRYPDNAEFPCAATFGRRGELHYRMFAGEMPMAVVLAALVVLGVALPVLKS